MKLRFFFAFLVSLIGVTGALVSFSGRATEVPRRVVAIGDLHGDLPQALAVMRVAGLVDQNGKWVGGTTILVQTGDTVDRGPDSRGVLDLLRALEVEAPRQGGKVIPLLGNHEAMNISGDLRYVNPADTAGFGGAEARRAAFATTGTYGAWLGTHDAVAQVGSDVFVHGGLTAEWAEKGIAAVNAEVRRSLFAESTAVLGTTGPLWYRGFVEEPESTACPALERSLAALGARRMVVGHTTQRDGRLHSRCGGRLDAIDIGIGSTYGGHVGVWESVNGDARAVYASGTVDLPEP